MKPSDEEALCAARYTLSTRLTLRGGIERRMQGHDVSFAKQVVGLAIPGLKPCRFLRRGAHRVGVNEFHLKAAQAAGKRPAYHAQAAGAISGPEMIFIL